MPQPNPSQPRLTIGCQFMISLRHFGRNLLVLIKNIEAQFAEILTSPSKLLVLIKKIQRLNRRNIKPSLADNLISFWVLTKICERDIQGQIRLKIRFDVGRGRQTKRLSKKRHNGKLGHTHTHTHIQTHRLRTRNSDQGQTHTNRQTNSYRERHSERDTYWDTATQSQTDTQRPTTRHTPNETVTQRQ